MIPIEWLEQALERIRPHTVRTPLTFDPARRLYIKWENHQVTGSFKARGALNKVLSLEDWERQGGLVAASAGNHGQGVALAGALTGSKVVVFVPAAAVQAKVDAIRALGGDVHHVEGGYGEAEQAAKEHAAATGGTFVSPYNDGQIIAGQATIALEILAQLRDDFAVDGARIGAWFVPTGGGGLISGCGAALSARGAGSYLVGVQPDKSAFTYSLISSGTQEGVRDDPTLADGLSGAIDEESITIPLMREFVSVMIKVSEDAIEQAIASAWWEYRERIEGSGAVSLAAALDGSVVQRPAVVIVTGGNIEGAVFEEIVRRHKQGATA